MSSDKVSVAPIPLPGESSILGIPLNRIITFLGPQISLVAGTVATWVLVKLNVLGISTIDHDKLVESIATGVTFGLGTVLTWLGQRQWLLGHHIQLAALTPDVQEVVETTAVDFSGPTNNPPIGVYDADAEVMPETSDESGEPDSPGV